MKICPKCAYVFTCGYADTDKEECKKYEYSNLSEEDFNAQIDNIKNCKKMSENKKAKEKKMELDDDEMIAMREKKEY